MWIAAKRALCFYLLYEECQTVVGAAMKIRLPISVFIFTISSPHNSGFYVQYAGQQDPAKPLTDCKPLEGLKIKKNIL